MSSLLYSTVAYETIPGTRASFPDHTTAIQDQQRKRRGMNTKAVGAALGSVASGIYGVAQGITSENITSLGEGAGCVIFSIALYRYFLRLERKSSIAEKTIATINARRDSPLLE